MFRVSHTKELDQRWAVIVGEPKVILSDDVPILFTGKNVFGNRVLGSFVYPDDEASKTERYMHILLSDGDYRNFYAGNVSYLQLLKDARPIFIVDKDPKTQKEKIGYTNFANIPEGKRPTERTFFPELARKPSIKYSTNIKGGAADDNLANPSHVSTIQNKITAVIEKSLHAIQTRIGFTLDTKLSPATASSYGINYVVTFSDPPFVFASEDQLLKFVNEFTEFCIDHLPEEIDQLIDRKDEKSVHFQQLLEHGLTLVPMIAKNEEDLAKRKTEFRNDLRKDVLAVPPLLEPVSDIIRTSYSSLTINNNDIPLGAIDSQFSASLDKVMTKLNETTVDTKLRQFRIRVYSYNIHSGNGLAELLLKEELHKIGIHVRDFVMDTHETDPYLESMRTGNFMDVVGRMTTKGKDPHSLEI